VRALSQARAPLGSMVMSIVDASIESTRHPSANEVLISSRVTRRGPPHTRLPVAEAQHDIATPPWHHRLQAVDEGDAVVVVEDVEQPAVEHGVEGLAERRQVDEFSAPTAAAVYVSDTGWSWSARRPSMGSRASSVAGH
jgi:hypothetical protein